MSPQAPTLSPLALQGRAQTQLALGVLLVLSLAPTVADWVRGDFQGAGGRIVGAVLTALVLWQVYRGATWALYLTVVLSVLGGLGLMLLSGLNGFKVQTLILFAVGAGFAVSGLALYSQQAIRAFLEGQRGHR
ncbi:hypothetical protein MF271_05275 [Deinococcus sp. KNUC1210]|uniref:hypothetical protein n=1 Tax=Deinococcus sp. KNUC1210 TaxID=2917691 RepID=UPI001EF0E565|nr:hypothetical protein [Deinococcus sp. KNUC1210]ULH16045.1 hypothetical protein MF271_05275 [Deinococcus sp. KNUC1210]